MRPHVRVRFMLREAQAMSDLPRGRERVAQSAPGVERVNQCVLTVT